MSKRKPATRVEIDFYMPQSFTDTHVIDTNHRGQAIIAAMSKYTHGEMKYVNLIHARLCDRSLLGHKHNAEGFSIKALDPNFKPIDHGPDGVALMSISHPEGE